jgi:uncharacterized protein YndB with AHSA1/START domain
LDPGTTLQDATQHEVTVALPQSAAFRLFTEGLGRWWPQEYTWGQDACLDLAMEPRLGGACFETGPHGFRCDWGRILQWEPPRLLAFTWQIAPDRTPQPDPMRASEVSVAFVPSGARTQVILTHRHFSRHGEGGHAYREEMGSPMGWPLLMARFAALGG